ncbi:MAG: DegT/DnrJ/EryC1/StrS family aminotransferase, partial [Candidatus Aureabacteria bacterium]|nr:DegT/DnrJ/EryC1/StrS family aminotransferase [Candidatus Auribacterota bacterium]
AALYDRLLSGVEEISTLRAPSYPHVHSHHLYIVFLALERVRVFRDEFLEELKKRNIGTGIHFRAVHTQAFYRLRRGAKKVNLPETEWASDRLFSLPLFPGMSDADAEDVVKAIKDVLGGVKK